MNVEKLPLDQYELRYGVLPDWFKIPGCLIVRRVDVLTNEAHLSVELPIDLTPAMESVQ